MILEKLAARPHEGFTFVEDADAHRALADVGVTFPDFIDEDWAGAGPRILYCVEASHESHWILGVRFSDMPENVDNGHLAMFLPKCRFTETMMNAKLEMLLAIIGKEANAVCVESCPTSESASSGLAVVKDAGSLLSG